MTKPLVDNGTFRRIADCPTPWPCFVIAVRNEVLKKHPNTIATNSRNHQYDNRRI